MMPKPHATVFSASPLKEQTVRALQGNPHLSKNYRLDVREKEGHVMLLGTVGTYFQKQMAQEVVRSLEGVEHIENCLEVAWS